MRVLRLIGSMDPKTGGPCQGIRNSITELSKMGVYNEVVCLDAPTAAYLGKDPFSIHALGPGKSSWCYSDKLLPWLLENMPQFDVLIVHGLWLYPSYAARVARKQLLQQVLQGVAHKVPKLFIMPHGMLDPYFQKASSRRLKAIRNWLYWKLIEHKVVRDADGVFFTSETELEMARIPFRPYQPKWEHNVGYGIQAPPSYEPTMRIAFQAHCPTLGDEPYLLFLSRIHEKKGVDLLIKAYAELQEQRSDLPKLVIAGPGLETPFGAKLQQFVKEKAVLNQKILFTGMLSGPAKWGSLYGCEAFILPSHQENFGIAVAEALACGKPVLISNQVNIWQEIIKANAGIEFVASQDGVSSGLTKWLNLAALQKHEMAQWSFMLFLNRYAIGPNAQRFLTAVSG